MNYIMPKKKYIVKITTENFFICESKKEKIEGIIKQIEKKYPETEFKILPIS